MNECINKISLIIKLINELLNFKEWLISSDGVNI